ncbi:MAG: hypothetical protein D3X82_16950 [Candidatus Leucobacter sulfamidivorax]|nr:hypothetical protein [Candidatus Leucobacter sulfamidivorax]
MTGAELLQSLLLVGGGAVSLRIIDMIRDALSAPGRRRRREVDRLATDLRERDEQLREARTERDTWRTKYRRVIESYHELRVWVIRTGLHDPADVPDIDDERG